MYTEMVGTVASCSNNVDKKYGSGWKQSQLGVRGLWGLSCVCTCTYVFMDVCACMSLWDYRHSREAHSTFVPSVMHTRLDPSPHFFFFLIYHETVLMVKSSFLCGKWNIPNQHCCASFHGIWWQPHKRPWAWTSWLSASQFLTHRNH